MHAHQMILIVDDRPENILPLRKILQIHGLESDSANSGEEALRKILQNEYALIIMDVQMPGMDGFEVVETLAGSSRTKDIPVIFLSAISKEKKYISRGYETGGVDYITKPVDPDLLILKVKTFLKLYQQQKELKDFRDLLSKEIEIRKAAQQELTVANEGLEAKVLERTTELTDKNEELESKNHELQQFAWVVSHDLKEPLRKIETFIGIIEDRYLPQDNKAIEYMNRTVRAAQRMSGLISDLLHYSRLSSDVVHEKVDLDKILSDVLLDFDHIVEEKRAVLSIVELPPVIGVSGQLRQLFQNLIGNALKFSKDGIAPEIRITAERIAAKLPESERSESGSYIKIEVSDNGIGFDEVYLDKIFVIFQSLNNKESYEGTGIGLAIAKKIVEKHNGHITARSRTGEGATFIITLPA